MYGIVNRAIQDMVCQELGEAAWLQVRQRAAVDEEEFLSQHPYPDALTYRLVTAVCEVTGREPAPVLESFGRYWVLETGRKRYGALLEAGGHTLEQFLLNLPNFHTRLSLMYPQMLPPEFLTEAVGPCRVRLRYFSQRPGLAPFVRGILLGLGELFATPVVVALERSRTQPEESDDFLVSWSAG